MHELYNEDCLEGMKRLADDSIDCIITDLPYNSTACAWDTAIDLTAMWTQFKRILKACCSAVLFASGKFTHKLIASNFDWYKYKWIWVKNAPTFFVHAKNAPMRKFEEILVFSDGVINHASCTTRRMKYNPQGTAQCGSLQNGKRKFGSIVGPRPSHVDCYVQERTGYPSDVLYYDAPSNTSKLHPSQKPVDLLEFLVRTYTNEGETVLDAAMGSGSTGVAAVNAGRNFIGYEIDEKYFGIAEERIGEERSDN